jgi:arginine N-succinyltransferase
VTLLPPHVQQLVGQVGPETKGVEKMLREIGFEYAQRIDPFDGGPHFHATIDEISLVGAAARIRAGDAPAPDSSGGSAFLVARESASAPFFVATKVLAPRPDNDGRLALPPDAREVLKATPGDELAILPL